MTSEPATHEMLLEPEEPGPAVWRANAYHVLARAFRTPAEWTPALPETLRERFVPPDHPLRELATKTADAWEDALRDPEQTAVAHARLFLGPFEIQAPPYASLYLDPQRRLMGAVSQEAARAYAEAGLGPGPGPREAPDHVACELEFMYFLAFQQATTADREWADRQQRFWQGHLGRWLPEFAANMAAAESHPFYDALARLLRGFAACEAKLLSGSEHFADGG